MRNYLIFAIVCLLLSGCKKNSTCPYKTENGETYYFNYQRYGKILFLSNYCTDTIVYFSTYRSANVNRSSKNNCSFQLKNNGYVATLHPANSVCTKTLEEILYQYDNAPNNGPYDNMPGYTQTFIGPMLINGKIRYDVYCYTSLYEMVALKVIYYNRQDGYLRFDIDNGIAVIPFEINN